MSKNNSVGDVFGSAGKWGLVFIVVLLAGCGSLTRSDAPATSTWWLEPLVTATSGSTTASAGEAPASVLVSIDVIPGLDTADILNLSPSAELSRFTGARWADELPELLRSLVGRSLESTGQYEVVRRRDSQNLNRCTLRLQVNAFYAEITDAGSIENVRVAVSGEYNCKNSVRRVLAFDERVPVGADKMSTIVAAFQSGLNEAMRELISRLQAAD